MIALLLLATATPEAVALGERLAASGTLAMLAPMKAREETEQLIAEHAELSEADRAALRVSALATAVRLTRRIIEAEGKAYAETLDIADLRVLVAVAESDAARRQRAALPKVIAGTIAALGTVDFKRDAIRDFCASSGKLCTPGAK